MPRQIVARALLVCAVLLAQQTALAHELWHATPHAQKTGKAGKLCELHDLLGTVLGAVSSAPPQAELLSFSEARFPGELPVSLPARGLAARSRGPPPVLTR